MDWIHCYRILGVFTAFLFVCIVLVLPGGYSYHSRIAKPGGESRDICYDTIGSAGTAAAMKNQLQSRDTGTSTIPARRNRANTLNNDKRSFLLPQDDILKTLSKEQLHEIYWRYINTLQVLCHNTTRLGTLLNGGKDACIDDAYKPKEHCLVYSFGSQFKFDFEIDVINRYNCEVHTFDPSRPVKSSTIIPKGVKFHLIGLSDRHMTANGGWHMETLSSIRKQLNHTRRIIDVLKIDIELWEWAVLPEMIRSGVLQYAKQLCLEVHFRSKWPNLKLQGVAALVHELSVLRKLYDHGFRIFMRDHNIDTIWRLNAVEKMTPLNEISLINVNFTDI